MYPIPAIKIDDSVPASKQNAAIEASKDLACWFFLFDDEVNAMALHEAIHLLYLRKIGFELQLYGPRVIYNANTEELLCRFAMVELPPDDALLNANPIAGAKAYIGPNVILKKLTAVQVDRINEWTETDIAKCRRWWKRKGQSEDTFDTFLELVEHDIVNELQDPGFRAQLEQTAREFQAKVFA